MKANESGRQKRAVEQLNFGTKTSKRVAWEAWEFTIVGPHQVEVTNASYGFLKDEHSYTVGIEEREGLAVPAECECPADIHRDPDCKHKVALAAVGGPVVLEASVNYLTPSGNPERSPPSRLSDKLRADGGATTGGVGRKSNPLDTVESNECEECTKLSDLPCWPCYRDGVEHVDDSEESA